MKRIIKMILIVVIVGLLVFGIYKFFIDCNKKVVDFDRNFVLEKFDYARVGKEAIVKLVKIEDYRCLEEDCNGKGEIEYKLLVLNDRKISYITLGSVASPSKDIEKLGYAISVEETNDDVSATFKLTRLEKKVEY